MEAWHELTRQCTATNRAGERCGRAPIPGGNVCVMHGGAIPTVQRAAKQRLTAMVEPVLETFEQILALWHATRCDKCGRPTGDPMPVIRVGQLVLDRAGFHPTLNVEREPAPLNKFAGLTPDELVAKVEAMLEHALALRDRSRQRFAIDATSDEPGADSEVDDASKGDT